MRGLFYIVFFSIGAVVGAQFPGFTSQYEQRLDGAINELRTIILRFDQDAAEQNLSRQDALETYNRAGDEFLVKQGLSMREVFIRYDKLTAHQQALQNANAFEQAAGFVQYFDPELAEATWAQYDISVPLNAEGGAFGAIGGALAWLTAAFGWGVARLPFRRRNRLKFSD
ncbi:hypothetical protein MXMO3_00006 [Maritalea myrionectae]|uniref:DUF2937 family protein n=1 Tax=Maritalea myrionectae TaxID=454601 RepID=A0A2R4M9C6_9HYPH|nr:DUF2937 family protein [Maritalea myrionectae]AVX02555.1 hypothetical protein MXMO3_00006 [Maritalea myrionectae]